MSARLHWPAGRTAEGADPVAITPRLAGWRYTGLRVVRLAAGESRRVTTTTCEMLVLPLRGGCTVEVDGRRYVLEGRTGVLEGISDFVYLPVGAQALVSSPGGAELALPSAEASRRLPPAYVPARDIGVETRGAGGATRQVNNLFVAGGPPAHRLIVVEVLTPGGNWSSYPPHKHDDAGTAGEAALEEIYYFRIPGAGGFGIHRTYTADRSIDETVVVRDGDVFLVPRGYHGPCVAPPEYPMYYLNVLAGMSDARSLGYSDDPAYAWIRGTWGAQAPDPRVPLVSPAEALR
jgi:5-deoxy-glucuronate isomerase